MTMMKRKDIIELVQECFETGQWHSDKELKELGCTTKQRNFYVELQELGPYGFYKEYESQLDWDPDFVAEFGGVK